MESGNAGYGIALDSGLSQFGTVADKVKHIIKAAKNMIFFIQ